MYAKFTSLLFAFSLISGPLLVCSTVFAQDANSTTNSIPQVVPPSSGPDNPTIIPPHPDAIDGGNPFQGLGRPDDTGPSRWQQYIKPDGTSVSNATDQTTPSAVAAPTGDQTGSVAPSSENKPIDTVPKLNSESPSELTNEAGLTKENSPKESLAKEGLPKEELPKENSKESVLEKKEEAKKEEGLQPAKIEKDSPTRRALHALQTGHYEEALTKLRVLSAQNANDAQVHYLLAVTNVMLRRFQEASTQYKLAVKLAGPGSNLAELAQEGLRKLVLTEKFGVQ